MRGERNAGGGNTRRKPGIGVGFWGVGGEGESGQGKIT